MTVNGKPMGQKEIAAGMALPQEQAKALVGTLARDPALWTALCGWVNHTVAHGRDLEEDEPFFPTREDLREYNAAVFTNEEMRRRDPKTPELSSEDQEAIIAKARSKRRKVPA